MRPNTWILGLPSQVSSPTPLCPVKTDYCLLTLVVRGNSDPGARQSSRRWIPAPAPSDESLDKSSDLSGPHFPTKWTSKLSSSLGCAELTLSHGKAKLGCKATLANGYNPPVVFKQLMGFRKMAVCHMIHPGPPTVLEHPSAHILVSK